jgi:hypothetical protein
VNERRDESQNSLLRKIFLGRTLKTMEFHYCSVIFTAQCPNNEATRHAGV